MTAIAYVDGVLYVYASSTLVIRRTSKIYSLCCTK